MSNNIFKLIIGRPHSVAVEPQWGSTAAECFIGNFKNHFIRGKLHLPSYGENVKSI